MGQEPGAKKQTRSSGSITKLHTHVMYTPLSPLLPGKTGIYMGIFFLISYPKHRLWLVVRTYSPTGKCHTFSADFFFKVYSIEISCIMHIIYTHYEYLPMQYTEIFLALKINKISAKNFDIFLIFAPKHRLWVHVRTASPRRF